LKVCSSGIKKADKLIGFVYFLHRETLRITEFHGVYKEVPYVFSKYRGIDFHLLIVVMIS